MLLHQRQEQILSMLEEKGIVYTAQLQKEFHCSFETIRKDLRDMEHKKLLTRVHGGATPFRPDSQDSAAPSASPLLPLPSDFRKRCMRQRAQKEEIARYACTLIQDGCCVALDSGTTSYILATFLVKRFKKLTIVTNSLINAFVLSENSGFTVIVTGGILSDKEKSLFSEYAFPMLDHINIDLMFLTTCGIDLKMGIAEQDPKEVAIHKKMTQRCKRLVVLADSSKFTLSASFHAYDFSEIESIITDSLLPEDTKKRYEERGIRVLTPQDDLMPERSEPTK